MSGRLRQVALYIFSSKCMKHTVILLAISIIFTPFYPGLRYMFSFDFIDDPNDGKRQLTHIEELAAMIDFKRRRQSYRAKNVHITKKSHTEVINRV